ncbi:hypothetical protein [Actibacterium sp. 188UL27-1]|nr:hypothetical protein [Actibacterium sp. 188UL27-1]
MKTQAVGYNSVLLLLALNSDRLLYVATIATALMGGAFVGSLVTQ